MSNTPGGMPPLNVQIRISTTGAGGAASAMRAVAGASGTMGSSIASSAVPIRMMGDAMRQTASLIKYSVLGGFLNMGKAAMDASRQMEVSMSRIQGLVGISAAEVEKMKQSILELGGDTTKSPLELADALYFITSSGFEGAKAMEILTQSAKSAAAGLGETQVIADALTSVMSAYGEGTYDAADAADILTVAVREGKAEADQFAPALGKVLPVAAAFGASFEDVSAGVAALSRTGSSAGTAAIYLRQVLSQLLKPSKQAADTMKSVGLSAETIRTQIAEDGLLVALEGLNTALGGNEYDIASAGLAKVFGNVRALTAVYSLLGPNLQENRDIFAEMADSTGAANAAFEVAAQTADAKFKSALAEVQAIMVRLGDQIMPVVADLVEFGGAILNGVNSIISLTGRLGIVGTAIGKVGKYFLGATTVLFLFAKSGLFVFTRGAALLRLFANMQITIKGLTTGIRTMSGTTKGLGVSMGFLSKNTVKSSFSVSQMNYITAQGAISEQAYYRAIALTTGNQTLRTIATQKAATASTTAAVANQGLAWSEMIAAVNAKILGRALMNMVPIVGTVIMVGMILFDIFKGIFGKKKSEEDSDGIDKRAKSLGELNKLMGVTVKLATSGFTMEVKTAKNDEGLNVFQEFAKTIPEDFNDAVKEINKRTGNDGEKIALAAGFLDQLVLTDKQRTMFASYLADLLNISGNDVLNFDNSGTAAAISQNIDGMFIQAFQGSDKDYVDEVRKEFEGPLNTAGQQLDALLNGVLGADNRQGATNDIKSIFDTAGESVGNLVDSTGDVVSFSKSLTVLRTKIGNSGMALSRQNEILNRYTEAVFKSITGTADFTSDSQDLQTVFKDTANASKFVDVLEKGGMSLTDATAAVEELTAAYDNDEVLSAAEQYEIFTGVVDKYTVAQDAASQATKDVMASAYDLGSEFADGLSPAIRELVDEYDAAKNALDNYAKGQEAIKGTAVGLDDAAIDYRDSLRELNGALKDSGGSLANSALGDKAKTAVKGVQEAVLEYVNAYQVANPKATIQEVQDVARQRLIQGYSAIKDIFKQTGVDIEAGNAYLNSIKFDFTGTGVLEEYISTYFGANTDMEQLAKDVAPELPKAILDNISAGIVADGGAAAAAALPGIQSMGDAILKQFKDYWDIQSPSQVMKKQIGIPLVDGIVAGINDPASATKIQNALDNITVNRASARALNAASARGAAIAAAYANGVLVATGATKIPTKDLVAQIGEEDALANADLSPSDGKSGSDKASPAEERGDAFRNGKQYGKFFKNGITRGLAESFLKDKGKITTPIMDLIEDVIGDASSALGTIGKYIDAQLGFQKALGENLKLANEQMLLQSNVAKAERDAAFAKRKFGAQGGAAVTDYEIAQIEDLQKTLEKVTRDYSMRRVDIRAVIDAENALREAQAASVEVSRDVISADNAVIDANTAVATAGLEASKSIYEIVSAQEKLTDAAIDFRINGRQATAVFEQFANQALPGLAYQVDEATGVMYRAGIALTDDNGLFLKSIKGLGQKIFEALSDAANEAGAESTVPNFVQPARPIDTPADAGAGAAAGAGGPTLAQRRDKNSPFFGQKETGGLYAGFRDAVMALHPTYGLGQTKTLQEAKSTFRSLYDLYLRNNKVQMAMGGLVSRPTLATIGEAGPEMVVPLNGVGVTTALERLSAVRSLNTETTSSGREQIFNITVNNPVPETASESISRRMRSLSTAGLFG